MRLDIEKVRKDFPILQGESHGKPLVFLDSAASAQKPQSVIDAISKLYAQRSSLRKLGVAMGPLVAACIFFGFGNSWTEPELTWVLLAAAGLAMVPLPEVARAWLAPAHPVASGWWSSRTRVVTRLPRHTY